jgi:hypothetical protein
MCNKCNHKHILSYQCPCECHEVYYIHKSKDNELLKEVKGEKL